MSFGGFGGGGFGSNNQSSSGGGGFGFGANKTNTNTGFGSGFGSNANASGSSLFGGGSATGGFGSGGGFGSTSNTAFGGSSGFGANTGTTTGGGPGGGLFGAGNTTSSTGGGFGGFGNTPSTSTSFGTGASGGGLFGAQNKTTTTTGFGASGTTGGSIFGGGGTSSGTGAFGTSSTGAFGAPSSTALSGNIGDPPGTASVAFSAFQEKEPNGTTNNTFQNLCFQDAFKKWSAEELRLVDYVQGRRYGNTSGTGAFGVSSGFGGNTGFGANTNTSTSTGFGGTSTGGGGLFGGSSTTPASGGFGSTTATSGGFGATSGGGGLFGQNKPATTGGGLFGSGNTATATSGFGSTTTGGGFGGASNTTGSFGGSTTGGGLFGSNTASQPKTGGFGGFGSTTATNTSSGFGATNTGTGFGQTATNTASGGLFGSGGNTQSGTTGGSLFGGGANQQQQSNPAGTGFGGGGFGNTNQQQATTGGLFGNANAQQQKPGGLFGQSTTTGTTGGGLFGGNTNTSGSAFGAANTQSSTGGGGLFGAAKPAAATGGLFGQPTQQQNPTSTGGGLFGSIGQNPQNQQQSTGSGLFGSANQTQAKPSLFGGSTMQNTGGGGLFGTPQNANQSGSSLFGGNMSQQQQQQQQNTGLGNSMFATSQNNAQASQQSLTTNINDMSAYGTSSLFAGMGGNEPQNPGPLATPLSNKSKPRRSSILPMYKLNPASASRFSTPQKRGGFGFSYSTYGTPGSASSVCSTPGGMNQSLLLGNSTRGLKTSVSTSSLRRSFNAEDSILTPGAFSTSNQRFGSVKKLVINREMRSDLFATPQKDKNSDPARGSRLRKHVSFEDSNSEAESTPLPLPAPPQESVPEIQNGSAPFNGASSNGATNGSQESVETPRVPQVITPSSPKTNSSDPTPGAYWMEPTVEDILRMSRAERSAVTDFTVGRFNVGSVQFLMPVDLTNIDVENLFRDIIDLEPRSATVYKNQATKPPVGKGLNVPAKIRLEHSWPRNKKSDGKGAVRIKKHLDRLKRIPDTTFIDYNPDTGVWAFRVEHFTTYGLDYDDEEDSEVEPSTTMATFSDEPQSNPSTQLVTQEVPSPGFSPDEDTFQFRHKRRALPGAFDDEHYDYDEPEDSVLEAQSQEQSFLADRSMGSDSNALVPIDNEVEMEEEYAVAAGQGIASPTPGSHQAMEPEYNSPEHERLSDIVPETPGGILRARMRAIKDSTVPINMRVADGDDWQDMLQRTISPQKRDRALLKSLNADENYDSLRESVRQNPIPPRNRIVSDSRGFATSIDLMNSLFDKGKGPAVESPAKGFVKWPYERQNKTCDENDMDPQEKAYHNSIRPSWGPDGTIVFATAPRSLGKSSFRSMEKGGLLSVQKGAVSSEHREIRLGRFSNESAASALREQIRLTKCQTDSRGIPSVKLVGLPSIKSIFHEQNLQNLASSHEKLVWELASVLFDDLAIPPELDGTAGIETRLRRQQVSRFWQALVDDASSRCVTMGRSSEEKAIACLSGRRIPEACKHLLGARNFRLATLVSTIGTSDKGKTDMKEQLAQWNENNCLSEFSEPIRALYALLAGDVFVCAGKDIGPVENRLSTFAISRQFGLDWKQAFGLRLWYALSSKDDVAVAVRKFHSDLKKGEVSPQAWYIEQGIPPIWEDGEKGNREDLLWGLLKLYADPNTDIEAVLRPENSQLSPLDFRLTWQLGRALASSGKVNFGPRGNEKADSSTISFASQLVNEGSWLEATFVLLHLSNPEARVQAIREHLARHAYHIGGEQGEVFTTLVSSFKIPAPWVWEAKALFMRSVRRDSRSEVHCLLKAGAYNDAHRTFVGRVAPQAIIARDYHGLADLLAQFAGHERMIPDWRLGGEVYRDFLRLVGLQHRPDQISGQLVDKLLSGLPAMQEHAQGVGAAAGGASANEGVEARAAVMEMGTIVARTVIELGRRGQNQDISRVLGLPLTEDGYLKHSMDLSLAYYKELMAGGR